MAKTEKTVPMRSFVGVTDNSCANQETPRTAISKTAFIDAQTRLRAQPSKYLQEHLERTRNEDERQHIANSLTRHPPKTDRNADH